MQMQRVRQQRQPTFDVLISIAIVPTIVRRSTTMEIITDINQNNALD